MAGAEDSKSDSAVLNEPDPGIDGPVGVCPALQIRAAWLGYLCRGLCRNSDKKSDMPIF